MPAGTIALVLCLLLIVRLMLQKQKVKDVSIAPCWWGLRLRQAVILPSAATAFAYPVVINLTMLALFSYSLHTGPCMIERLARLKEPDLPDEAIPYLKKSHPTLVRLIYLKWLQWRLIPLALPSLATWTLYNGLIAYVLMGLLLGGNGYIAALVEENMTQLLKTG